jgi:hypothetical protein
VTARAEHPFLELLSQLPDRFPELRGNDEMAQIARMIVIPSIRAAAKKEPEKIREAVVAFLARFVVGLEIRPDEIYGPPAPAEEISSARASSSPADPSPDPVVDERTRRILAGDA